MQSGGMASLGQQVVEQHDFVRRLNLGHHQGRRGRVRAQDRLHVGNAELLAERIDTHDALDPVVRLRALE